MLLRGGPTTALWHPAASSAALAPLSAGDLEASRLREDWQHGEGRACSQTTPCEETSCPRPQDRDGERRAEDDEESEQRKHRPAGGAAAGQLREPAHLLLLARPSGAGRGARGRRWRWRCHVPLHLLARRTGLRRTQPGYDVSYSGARVRGANLSDRPEAF